MYCCFFIAGLPKRLLTRSTFVIGAVVIILMQSCTVEHQLARQYLRSKPDKTLLIIPTDFIYKSNLTYQEPDPVTMIDRLSYDSAGYYRSTYLQYISDSAFLEKFYNAFIAEMTDYGYRIFLPDDSLAFDRQQGQKWKIRFAQLQMEEETKTHYIDTYDPDDNYYYKEYDLTTVGINSWTEVAFDLAADQQRLLYLSGFIQDDFEGGFSYNRFDDKMYFTNRMLKITYSDIYRMAEASGKKHAELLSDYLLNDYIRRNMPPGVTRRLIYHYDRRFRTLTTDVTERFEVLK